MVLTPGIALSVLAMLSLRPQLKERALADVAVIGVPRSVKEEMYKGIRDDPGRLTFTFATSYFWASFGSGTAYKQQLFVSLMAPDASDAEYDAYPRNMSLIYEPRKTVGTTALGSGTLTVVEGTYRQNSLAEPAHTLLYVDRRRRLQIAWHAVTAEVDRTTATALIGGMAASFRQAILSAAPHIPTSSCTRMRPASRPLRRWRRSRWGRGCARTWTRRFQTRPF